jgi:hypothetical protein
MLSIVGILLMTGVMAPAFGADESTEFVLQPSGVTLRSVHSYMDTQPGYDLVVASTYSNTANVAINASFVVEVRDSAGVTVLLYVLSAGVESGQSMEFGASWIPEDGGTYHLRTFSFSNDKNPYVLSPVLTQSVRVNDYSAGFYVQAGNKEYEIPVSMSFGWARIEEDARLQEYWPTLVVNADISHNGANITFTLPLELLKRWESASGQEYCVGFPLDVIIDGQSVAASISEPTPEGQVVSIPIDKGFHKIEFIGLSLLISPPACG